MIYYVCKHCNYKHTFQPFACARCHGTDFYPLIAGEVHTVTSPIIHIGEITDSSDKRLEPILQKLIDLGVIKSWYYNGTYHAY